MKDASRPQTRQQQSSFRGFLCFSPITGTLLLLFFASYYLFLVAAATVSPLQDE